MNKIEHSDFEKLDLRVAEIINVEDIEGADKLYKLTVDLGELGERTICAGIKKHYEKDYLLNKKVIILTNLEPRKLKGIVSEGMLLAAEGNDGKIIFLTAENDVESGSKIK